MTIPNWDYRDYEVVFDDINILSNTPLIELPFIIKVSYLLKYILGGILPDAIKPSTYGNNLGGLFVTLASIDYLAGYYVGRETHSKDYKAFMKRYFPDIYYPYLDTIYSQIRCGLMHNLVALDPWKGNNQVSFLIQDHSTVHLVEIEGRISFSIPIFIMDTARAFVMYQYDLIMKQTENEHLIKNFEKRFNRLNGRASVMNIVPDKFTA
jgi:hypothetical protein